MDIKVISEQELIEYLRTLPPVAGSFLQTPWWYKLMRTSKDQAEYLGIYLGEKMVGVATTIVHTVYPGLCFAYAPRGPIVVKKDHLRQAVEALRDFWKKRGVFYLRVEPVALDMVGQDIGRQEEKRFLPRGFHKIYDTQPSMSVVIDLEKSEEELMKVMHQKTRYNIHLAEKKDLHFRWASLKDFDIFWQLLQYTAARSHFRPHAFTHYHNLLKDIKPEGFSNEDLGVRLVVVEHQGETLASCVEIACLGVVTYLHGSSSRFHTDLKAPHLLHWRMIQAAKAAGFKFYDFWGVQTDAKKYPDWAGFTRFKLGFSQRPVKYLGSFDYVYNWSLYIGYRLGHTLNNWLWWSKKLWRRLSVGSN